MPKRVNFRMRILWPLGIAAYDVVLIGVNFGFLLELESEVSKIEVIWLPGIYHISYIYVYIFPHLPVSYVYLEPWV